MTMTQARQIAVLHDATIRLCGLVRRKRLDFADDLRWAEWKAVDARRRRAERRPFGVTVRLFDDQRRDVLRRIDDLGDAFFPAAGGADQRSAVGSHVSPAVALKSDLIVSRIFDLDLWEREIDERYPPVIADVVRQGWQTGFARIGIDGVDFTSGRPEVRAVIDAINEKTRGINPTTQRELTDLISRELPSLRNKRDLADLIEARFRRYRGARALMIAETVTTGGFERGQTLAYAEAGVEAKGWLSQRDDAVRETHWEADGQIVLLAERFDVGGVQLEYPGDPGGPAREVIRCRCTTTPERLPDPSEAEPVEDREDVITDPGEWSSEAAERIHAEMMEMAAEITELARIESEAKRRYAESHVDDLPEATRSLSAAKGRHENALQRAVNTMTARLQKAKSANFGANFSQAMTDASLANARQAIDWIRRIVGPTEADAQIMEVERLTGLRGRSYFDARTAKLHMADSAGFHTFVHEIGHWLEHANGTLRERARAFYAYRTAGDAVEKIADYVPWYGPGELIKKDKWPEFYVGKWYVEPDGNQIATEIFSMGLEYLSSRPAWFAATDPEYFRFVVSTLEGL